MVLCIISVEITRRWASIKLPYWMPMKNFHQCNTKHRRWKIQCQLYIYNFSCANTKSWHYQHHSLNLCYISTTSAQNISTTSAQTISTTPAQTISTAPAQTISSKTLTPTPTLDTVKFWQVDANAVKVTTSGKWWLFLACVNFTVNSSSISDVQLLWFNLTSD